MTIKILSIDGGGIRGIIPARILAALEQKTGKPCWQLFDLVAGTSTGGILALALTKPRPDGKGAAFSAQELVNLYREQGRAIFARSFWHTAEAVGNLNGPKYDDGGIGQVLQQYFGEARLKDALVDVVVPAYEIERRTPFLFRSWRAKAEADHDFRMREVARATSAAPTYFAPEKIATPDGSYWALVDGGVYANNPAMVALVDAHARKPDERDFVVVSLGTGNPDRRISYDSAKGWGLASWAHPLIDILIDGVSDAVDRQVSEVLQLAGSDRYYRLQADLPCDRQDMDDASPETIQALIAVADRLMLRESARISAICKQLTQGAC